MNRFARPAVAALCAVTGVSALSTASAQAHDKTQAVDIKFAGMAGDQPVACGTLIDGLGSTAQAAQLQDFRFFVSEVKLTRADGTSVAVKLAKNSPYRYTRNGVGVTLIDLENGTGDCAVDGTRGMNASVKGTVPHGKYVGVSWTVGVPFALNHTDAAATPAPLNSVAMGWSWQIGHKFTKIEVSDPGGATGSWTSKTFYVHLGSAGCEGNPATGQSRQVRGAEPPGRPSEEVRPGQAAGGGRPQGHPGGYDVTANQSGAPGCMSEQTDPECGSVFKAFGVDWKADGTGTGKPSRARRSSGPSSDEAPRGVDR